MSTLCVLVVAFVGLLLIVRLCIPFNALRTALVAVVVAGTALGATLLPGLFDIAAFTQPMVAVLLVAFAVNAVAFQPLYDRLSKLDQAA